MTDEKKQLLETIIDTSGQPVDMVLVLGPHLLYAPPANNGDDEVADLKQVKLSLDNKKKMGKK